MSIQNLTLKATRIRERTGGLTIFFLPPILLSLVQTFFRICYSVLSFHHLRQDSGLVNERLTNFLSLFYIYGEFGRLLLHLFFGFTCFQLLQLIRGDRPRVRLKDSLSLLTSDWRKPICDTILTCYLLRFLAGLPAHLGLGLFAKGIIMECLMILSPGAMAELKLYHPSQLILVGLSVFILGVFIDLIVGYTYSQANYVLYDQLDNASYESPIRVLKASRLLMKGAYGRRIHLDLSFLGWFIGDLLTLRLLSFFVMPYYQLAKALFYEELETK